MKHSFRKDDLVTWGSGDIRAAVVSTPADEDDQAGVKLVRDYKSPCGRIWPAGTKIEMPVVELRHLQ